MTNIEKLVNIVKGVLASYNSPEFTKVPRLQYGKVVGITKLSNDLEIRCYYSGNDDKHYATAVMYKIREEEYCNEEDELFRFYPTGNDREVKFSMDFYSRLILGTPEGILNRILEITGLQDAINNDL